MAAAFVPAGLARDDADRAYRAGTGLLNRGMNDAAAAEYRAFLNDHADHPKADHARYGLAVCLVRMGKCNEAVQELDRVVTKRDFEFAPDAKLLRGRCSFAADDFRTAIVWFERTIREHPGYPQLDSATAQLGESHYRIGNAAKPREALETLVTRWPQSPSRERGDYLLALCDVWRCSIGLNPRRTKSSGRGRSRGRRSLRLDKENVDA